MAISFVGSAEANAINGANVTVDLTAITGLAEDDLVIFAYSIGTQAGNHDMAATGYTEVADLFSDDGGDTNLGVFYKFMTATPDSSVTGTGNANAGSSAAAVAFAFRGVDLTTPMDVTATTATGINTMHPNPPSIDFADVSAWTVIAVGNAHQTGGAGTYTFPTGYTTDAREAGADDTVDTTCGMAYNSGPADPEDPGALTHTGTDSANYSWAAVTMALRPAAGGAASISFDVGMVAF